MADLSQQQIDFRNAMAQLPAAVNIITTNGHLCVNVLCGEQEELARHFAGMTQVPMAERFAWDLWDDGAADVPVLRDALVQLEGRISECKEVGSHSVMFVELTKVGVREPRDSLVYFNRLFHRVEHASAA